jgi:DNA-binding NarL/FixJ family response regulator
MKKIKILLADDNAMIRTGIRELLGRLEDIVIVSEASSISEAIDALEGAAPAIVVTDIGIGCESGLDLVRVLKQRIPEIPSIVLSMHLSEVIVAEALRRGASAYLVKEEAVDELEMAIRAVARGEIYLSVGVSKKMIKWFAHSGDFVRPVVQA